MTAGHVPVVAPEEVAHPHDLRATIPDRLPASVVRRLAALDPRRALGALAAEWLGIAAAIVLAEVAYAASPATVWLYPLLVMWIGARQQALSVIGHDAAHHRFLPDRRWNDLVRRVGVVARVHRRGRLPEVPRRAPPAPR